MKDGPMDALERSTPAEVYEQYLGRAIADPFTRVLLDHAAPKQGERVLDLASGTGSVARQVAPMVGRQGRVVAVDINPAMLAVGRAMSPPAGAAIEWLEGNAIDLDLPDAAFDLVLCQQGLQFFPDRVGAAREMRRVLMPQGRVAISVWQTLARHPVYEALFKATASHLGARMSAMDVSFSFGDPEQLRAVLRNGGFDRIDIVPRSLEHQLAIAGAVRAAHGARSGNLSSGVRSAGPSRAGGARQGGLGRDGAHHRALQERRRIDVPHAHQYRDRILILSSDAGPQDAATAARRVPVSRGRPYRCSEPPGLEVEARQSSDNSPSALMHMQAK
jgi:ubiquinone/menaquinone biosynthesis C-methylase UbiE